MDPITAATAAFSAIKVGLSAGQQLASLGKEIGSLFDSIDEELLKERAKTRKERKLAAEKAAKARQKKIENLIIYGSITAILAMALGFAALILLAQQGKI